MMRESAIGCDTGRLTAYRDENLAPEEHALVARHLESCDACRKELDELERQRLDAARAFEILELRRGEVPPAEEALARFRMKATSLRAAPLSPPLSQLQSPRRTRFPAALQPIFGPRRTAFAAAMLVLVVVLASFAPARQVAARFLSIFRVREFAVVPISNERMPQLESLHNLIKSGALGQPTVVRQPGPKQRVASAEAAAALAGHRLRVPSEVPAGARIAEITVEPGPAMRIEVDAAKAQSILEAAGVKDISLPAIGISTVEVDVPMLVHQEFALSGADARLSILQAKSPTVTLASGADPRELGELMLRVVGLSTADAQRLAQTIDWTSTLVIPIPPGIGRFSELNVDGVRGLLLEEEDSEGPSHHAEKVVVWQRDGVLYGVCGQNITDAELLRVANSLH